MGYYDNEDSVWDWLKWVFAALLVLVFLFALCNEAQDDYELCMKEKQDRIVCETYVRVKYDLRGWSD